MPAELTDEAAAQVAELLHDLTVASDCQYFAHIRRHYDDLSQRPGTERSRHDGQLDLFDGDDVPFRIAHRTDDRQQRAPDRP